MSIRSVMRASPIEYPNGRSGVTYTVTTTLHSGAQPQTTQYMNMYSVHCAQSGEPTKCLVDVSYLSTRPRTNPQNGKTSVVACALAVSLRPRGTPGALSSPHSRPRVRGGRSAVRPPAELGRKPQSSNQPSVSRLDRVPAPASYEAPTH